MKQGRVISLARYKAQRLCGIKPTTTASVESALPDTKQLWELLDKNISIAVWSEASEA